MKELKKQLKQKNIASCYLFYGTEQYLKKYYTNFLKNTVLDTSDQTMNLDIFEGKKYSVSIILDSTETLPFLSQKRVVIIKESGLFQAGRKEDSEKMAEYIQNIPDTSCIIFVENEIDKRTKLYKSILKHGYVVEMNTPSEKELILWITKKCKENQLQIENHTAVYLLRTVGGEMIQLEEEIKKLSHFLTEKTMITTKDIDAICTKSLETKIFDLVDAVENGRCKEALTIYHNLILIKESPLMVLAMVIRQFRIILQCKILLEQGENQNQIGQKIGIRDFVVRQCLKQAKYFKKEDLQKALESCLKTDINIKTGKENPELAVELLLLQYNNKK